MFDKVFISYAREDVQFAKKIYEHLEVNNFRPWMDKEKLLVGQQWEPQIMNELRSADFIIILLSKTSVSKRGFVQREFKYALKYAEEKLTSDIFILPIKLDDCEVPPELGIFNWVHLGDFEARGKIIEALNAQRIKMMASVPGELIKLNDYSEHIVHLDGEINSLFSYEIKYPIFRGTTAVNTDMLNVAIRHYIHEQISDLYQTLFSEAGWDLTGRARDYRYAFEISYTIGLVNESYASIMFYEYTDYLAAHPNHYWTSINVAFNPNIIIRNLIISNNNDLKKLIENYKFDFGNKDDGEEIIEKEIIENNIKNFNRYSDPGNFYPKDFEYLLIDGEKILINFSNHLPHAFKALGQFEFKYKKQNHKIEIVG